MIQFCIPYKDNAEYIALALNSLDKQTCMDFSVCIYVDSDTDNRFASISLQRPYEVHVLRNTSTQLSGIAKAYNECIKLAYSKSIQLVCMFHADMVASPELVESVLAMHEKNQVLSITRIEPPLWPANKEKLIHSLGMYPHEFSYEKFLKVVSFAKRDLFTQGCFAPWVAETQVLMENDLLHDESLHSYHEDSDIFIRFLEKNLKLQQTWNVFVYHFTCRGGQFQNGIETLNQDTKFLEMKASSWRRFHRKWRFPILNDEFQHPIFPRIMYDKDLRDSYHVKVIYKNFSNLDVLEYIEPFADSIQIVGNDGLNKINDWIQKVSLSDQFNLADKFNTVFVSDKKVICIEFDEKDIVSETMHAISCSLFTIMDMLQSKVLDLDVEYGAPGFTFKICS